MISSAALADILAALAGQDGVADLRAAFPGIHFTECSEDDISPRAKPVAETESHLLYLVTGATGHCLALTNDFDNASGVVVARKSEGE